MIKFINNIGEYFASNYFDEDFTKKVIEKSGYSREALRQFQQQINNLKSDYFALKQRFVENHLRVKDRVELSHNFHTKVLTALGYNAKRTDYHNLYPISDDAVLPIRHILYRGDNPHMMVMEMHALIKTGEEEPDGLFEQSYHQEENETPTGAQKYHRSQWSEVFTVPEGVRISPMIINQAVSQLFLLPEHRRPKYILLCAGNQYFLLESEKWFCGSYLQLDLEILFDESVAVRDYLTLFYLMLGKDLLAPTADVVLMEQLDEDSHKAAYEVTKDLKEGVIHAVEQLANEAVHYLTQVKELSYSDINADQLKEDYLTMVYRLLFLFYAESREELDILPSNDPVYNRGYSLEMLRDLEQVPLQTESSRNGYFFHESLYRLFSLLNEGYAEANGLSKTFRIRHLDSPLFDAKNLNYLSDVKIRNIVWQDVILQLSLSKQQRNRNRGRISYANLGINQLGSVYESLLAFRGFLAETDYIEVHKKRTARQSSEEVVRRDGSFLVPRHRLEDFDQKEVYHEEHGDEEVMRIIPEGRFIYRLSGRDRQKSASYYTPEVLTQTTVKYTLKPILERLKNGEMKALDLLNLKILEPAMGAAAFHNEAINQIAHAYITYREEELGKRVEPNKYQEELQKVKAYIALNNVYGVDIDETAIELGKLSLWLNVIHKDMQTPFFGYRLGVGNAVIGSWLKVYHKRTFHFELNKSQTGSLPKKWWEEAPKHLKFKEKGRGKGINRGKDEIYHFLLPDNNMASSATIRLLRDQYSEEAKRVREWKKEFTAPIKAEEYKLLQQLSTAIDQLLTEHYELQKDISLLTQSYTDFFGNDQQDTQTSIDQFNYEQKENLAKQRFKTNAPYYKLKMIMDYWCALWFWDVRDAADLPTRRQWYEDIALIIGIDLSEMDSKVAESDAEYGLFTYRKDSADAQQLILDKLKEKQFSLFKNDRAEKVKDYATQYKFFHYELEFIEVFYENNGFDVAVGNPPWIKVEFKEMNVMSEIYPEFTIRRMRGPEVRLLRDSFMEIEQQQQLYFEENIESDVSATFMNATQNYPLLKGQQTNLYKCILENGLNWIAETGFLGLIHPEGVYDEPNGYDLRKEIYQRLIYHFQFKNELMLFAEVHHETIYGIHIYSGKKDNVKFLSISNLFHPVTIDESFTHSGLGEVHGFKVKNENTGRMEWNILPHQHRIVSVDKDVLKILARTFENSDDWKGAKLVSVHAKEIIEVIKKIGEFPKSLIDVNPHFTLGWNEVTAVNNQTIYKETKYPDIDNYELIYSGPHLFVGNPLYKNPREICRLNSHYDVINLIDSKDTFVPRTNYSPHNVAAGYSSLIQIFRNEQNQSKNWFDYYKVGFRKMVGAASERTLSGAIMPPKTAHIDGLNSVTFRKTKDLIEFTGLTSSIVLDFFIKTIGATNIHNNRLEQLPLGIYERFKSPLFVRILQLNCLNKYYGPLWKDSYQEAFKKEQWSIKDNRLKPFDTLTTEWTWDTPLRNYFERRQALVEIDVITAMALDITLDELILMYNIQFPVLQQNEDDTWYDTKGNIVFTASRGLVGVGLDRPDWNRIKDMEAGETYEHTIEKSELYYGEKVTYYAPFTKQDRVEDYKKAWAFFEERFNK